MQTSLSTIFKIAAIACLGLSLSMKAQAQQINTHYYKKVKKENKEKSDWFKRIEIGGHYSLANAEFQNSNNYLIFDGTKTTQLSYNFGKEFKAIGFGGQLGTYIPVTSVIRKSIFAITVHAQATFVTYDLGRIEVMPGTLSSPVSMQQTRLALPIGLEYKWGGQATLNKEDWASVGIGGGVAPTYEMFDKITVEGEDKEKFSIRPYIRVEAGFRTAIFWKLHATWMFSSIYNYKKQAETIPELSLENNSYVEGYMRTRPILNVGITFNIGSFGWDKFW